MSTSPSQSVIRLTLSLWLLLGVIWQPGLALAGSSPPANNQASQVAQHPRFSLALNTTKGMNTLAFKDVSAGRYHTCAVSVEGAAKCWGRNKHGQLGDGTNTDSNTPVNVSGLESGVTAIVVGSEHTCALTEGGGVKCWGLNQRGQLGDDTEKDRNVPVDVEGLEDGVLTISAGVEHTCAITAEGGAKCWGSGENGRLGNDSNSSSWTPVDVVGLNSGVTAIAAGGTHTCALTIEGGAKCWGDNDGGQLGDGTTSTSYTAVDVVGLDGSATSITAGAHTCALMANGEIKCWGYNSYGQLGDGTTTNRNIPVDVIGLGDSMIAIGIGGRHTCALTAGGGIKCWGRNEYGQLGDGTISNRNTPVDVIDLSDSMIAIAGNVGHSCAVSANGVIMCWGNNRDGQLGDGTDLHRHIPVDDIDFGSDATAITAGGSHTCALTAEGGAKCWGDNEAGQVGDDTNLQRSTPVDVVGLESGVMAIAAGRYKHSCALTASGIVKCWGHNGVGQLGDGTTTQRNVPVDVVGLESGVTAIAAGYDHTCALTNEGGVKCWGYNDYGQLGDGTTTMSKTPVDVVGLSSGVIAITAGNDHTCALTTAGGTKCWGSNFSGRLGDGTSTHRNMPVDVVGLISGVSAIIAGNGHTCALMVSGGGKCWGNNHYGQLGDGTKSTHYTPVDVEGLEGALTGIAIGYDYTCALAAEGGVKCWGRNFYGQFGNGTTMDSSIPVDVSGLHRNTLAVATGQVHACALVGEGVPKCWGWDSQGQLGIGSNVQSLTPVEIIESIPPYLTINYEDGRSGSFFTITGWRFPPDSEATLTINDDVITTLLQVNPDGSFIFFLNTSIADNDDYRVTVSVNGIVAHTDFLLTEVAPLRPQEGGGLTFFVPGSIEYNNILYLPLILEL